MVSRGSIGWVLTSLVALLLAGCGAIPARIASEPGSCGDIPASVGGCSSGRPVFVGSTCADVGGEWGEAVNQGVLSVMSGPPIVNDQQRSTRISDVLVLASIVAGMRLNSLNLLSACDVPEFLAAARPRFSLELLEGIGPFLLDGTPIATTQDWENLLNRAIRIIDEGEPTPSA